MNQPKSVHVCHRSPLLDGLLLEGPHFAPDATHGVVRAVGADDLARVGVRVLVTNALHLMLKPGISTITALGGAKKFLGWDDVLVTDSGGFQALSMIRENRKFGRIDESGLIFHPNADKKVLLDPRKSMQNQLRLGGDIIFCLDDCTHHDSSRTEQEDSVRRTVNWAKACRQAFDELCVRRDVSQKPLLFAVVQGGRDATLRRQCAESLLEIGFDGFGFGGWPIDASGALVVDMLALTRELIPGNFPMHALGVGHPASIVRCARMGYALFDSALPTRDARRGRLYTFTSDQPDLDAPPDQWLRMHYMQDEVHMKKSDPLSATCEAVCCKRYSAGYLHHLFRIEDSLFLRLATLHNLSFMTQLCRRISSRSLVQDDA